jgi:hypothetical protein
MSSNLSGDQASFQQFLAAQEMKVSSLSPEQSVELYRQYQQEIAKLRERVAASMQQAEQGQSRRLDMEAMMQRVSKRLDLKN